MKQTNAITTKQDPEALARMNDIMHQAGQAAKEQASPTVYEIHRSHPYCRRWNGAGKGRMKMDYKNCIL